MKPETGTHSQRYFNSQQKFRGGSIPSMDHQQQVVENDKNQIQDIQSKIRLRNNNSIFEADDYQADGGE